LGHESFLLVRVGTLVNLESQLFFFLKQVFLLVALVNFRIDLGLSTVKFLFFLELKLCFVDLNVILFNLSQLVLEASELVVK